MTSSGSTGRKSIGIALCISAEAHLALLSAATIFLRVPQTHEIEPPGTISVTGISEIRDQSTATAPRNGTPKTTAAVRSTGSRAPSSPAAGNPPQTVPRSAPQPPTLPTEAPGTAPAADSAPGKGDAEATGPGTGAGTAAGTAPGNGSGAPQTGGTGGPGGQEEFLSQDKVTDVPVIPEGEVLARIEYPQLAARQGIEAVVFLELYIDAQGRVRRVSVLKDPGYGFAEAAVRALSGVICTPAKAGGHPVAVRYRFPVRFSLN